MSATNKNPNYIDESCPYCQAKKVVRIDDELQCMSCGEAWMAVGAIDAPCKGKCTL